MENQNNLVCSPTGIASIFTSCFFSYALAWINLLKMHLLKILQCGNHGIMVRIILNTCYRVFEYSYGCCFDIEMVQ